MSEQVTETKPVIGSNEHHLEIDQRLARLEGAKTATLLELEDHVRSLAAHCSNLSKSVSDLRTDISSLTARVLSLETGSGITLLSSSNA